MGRHPCKFRAFVVGNNSYRCLPPLAKCVNDARAMGVLLQRKGYVVTVLEDAGVEGFAQHFNQFANSLSAGSTVVVHFSGHGCQVAGPSPNRLLFVDQTTAEAAGGGFGAFFKLPPHMYVFSLFNSVSPSHLFPRSLQTPVVPLTQ